MLCYDTIMTVQDLTHTKLCPQCGQQKPLTEFILSTTPDHLTYHALCAPCRTLSADSSITTVETEQDADTGQEQDETTKHHNKLRLGHQAKQAKQAKQFLERQSKENIQSKKTPTEQSSNKQPKQKTANRLFGSQAKQNPQSVSAANTSHQPSLTSPEATSPPSSAYKFKPPAIPGNIKSLFRGVQDLLQRLGSSAPANQHRRQGPQKNQDPKKNPIEYLRKALPLQPLAKESDKPSTTPTPQPGKKKH